VTVEKAAKRLRSLFGWRLSVERANVISTTGLHQNGYMPLAQQRLS